VDQGGCVNGKEWTFKLIFLMFYFMESTIFYFCETGRIQAGGGTGNE